MAYIYIFPLKYSVKEEASENQRKKIQPLFRGIFYKSSIAFFKKDLKIGIDQLGE